MSANDANPMGAVDYNPNEEKLDKTPASTPASSAPDPDEPIMDDGVNFDVYADDDSAKASSGKDINFESSEIAKRKKAEYFVKIEGEEKRKREEEKRATANARERIRKIKKNLAKDSSSFVPEDVKAAEKKNISETKRYDKEVHRRRFAGKLHAFKEATWSGKRKIVTIIVIVLLIALPIAGVWFVNDRIEAAKTEEIYTSARLAADINSEVAALMRENADNYDKCVKIFEDGLKNAKNDSEKVRIATNYATFVQRNTADTEKALEILDSVADNHAQDDALRSYYAAYLGAYGAGGLNDREKYNHYLQLAREVDSGAYVDGEAR
jgi:hypothetical protein